MCCVHCTGGENFELSFKIWQCGGSIEWVPCSRVGHVYRGFMPYNFGKLADKKKGPLITINYKRVIEVWFDDKYKEYFYTREPLARYLDMGDISQQLQLKEKLQCKSFQWYMDNVAYDVFDKFPPLPANLHWGELRSAATDMCKFWTNALVWCSIEILFELISRSRWNGPSTSINIWTPALSWSWK